MADQSGDWVRGGWDNWFMVDAIYATEEAARADERIVGDRVLFVPFGEFVNVVASDADGPYGEGDRWRR